VAITFTISDDQDATGATATIAGTGVAADNDVNVYKFGASGALSLAGTFSRTGNGTLTLAVATGSYFAILLSDGVFAGLPVAFVASDEPASTLGSLLAAVKNRIVALGLQGISAGRVITRKKPYKLPSDSLPAVFVCPLTEQMPNSGTNASDDTGYAVLIVASRASNQELPIAADDQLLAWRNSIAKEFREKRITGITGADFYRVAVEPGPVIDDTAFKGMIDSTAVILRCFAREVRP
jgi:hypothetical protein